MTDTAEYTDIDSEAPPPEPEDPATPVRRTFWGAAPLTMLRVRTASGAGAYAYLYEGELVPDTADPDDLERLLDDGYIVEKAPDGFIVDRAVAAG